jgi:type VI secretion system protein ImpK
MPTEHTQTDTKNFTANWQDASQDILTLPTVVSDPNQTHQNSYYRSKLAASNAGINPMVSAASTLFLLATTLQNLATPPDVSRLQHDLYHEMKAFEIKAQSLNYRAQAIQASRYVLCALLDEVILATAWGRHSGWQQQNLLTTFQSETWGGEKFFVILQRSCEEPALHIDLLELIYICLSIGYEGKFKLIEQGQQKLHETTDELYRVIQQQRGEFSKRLTLTQPLQQINKKTAWLLPVWMTALFTLLCVSVVYVGFSLLLEQQTATVYHELINLQHTQ